MLGGKERFFAGFERKESTGKVGVRQIAGAPGLSMNRLVAALIGYVAEMGADRILFSADYPFEDMLEAASWFDALELNEPDLRKIASEIGRAHV